METVLFHTIVSMVGGLITVVIAYLIYRKPSVSVWGWIASFFPDMPIFWLAVLGATGLGNVMLLTHTVGIFIFPIFLVIIDILLIEIAWLRYVSWLPYPRFMRTVGKFESFIEKLEKYNAIPRPVRVQRVYIMGVLAGAVHLVINLFIGSL